LLVGASLALGLFASLPALAAMDPQPCCSVVSVDKAAGVVTLRDNKTGQYARVKVTDAAKLAKLQAGQAVDANIGIPLGAGMSGYGQQE
jgi:hypothetical protein